MCGDEVSLVEAWRHLSPALETEKAEDGFSGSLPGPILEPGAVDSVPGPPLLPLQPPPALLPGSRQLPSPQILCGSSESLNFLIEIRDKYSGEGRREGEEASF